MTYSRDFIYGLAAGGSAVVFSSAFYSIDREMFLGSMVYWGSTLILILFMILAMMHARSGMKKLAGFKELLKTGFIVYIIGNLLYYAFLFLLFNYLDPELQNIQRTQVVDWMIQQNDGDVNAPQVIQAKEHNYAMTISATLYAYARGLIFGFVVSAGLAYLLKEKPFY